MNDTNETTTPCPCCGSRLYATHAIGCPREIRSWRFSNGRQMPQHYVDALLKLAALVKAQAA